MSQSKTSIVIIGAGISGHSAAAKLIENGFQNITILEAEGRPGGRIHTTDFADGKIDLGAQWCHGINGNVVHELAGFEAFAETKMDFSRMLFMRSDRSKDGDNISVALMKICETILADLKGDNKSSIDELLNEKFKEALASDQFKKTGRSLCFEVLENFKRRECSYCGCDNLTQISVDGFTQFKDCAGPTWLNWKGKGYKTIFEKVLSNVTKEEVESKIQLKKEVVNIDYHGIEKISVKCSDGQTYLADHVIVTASLGVLKRSHTTLFTPELPDRKKLAIDSVKFGAVGKIFLQFEKKFWPNDWVGFSLLWRDEDLEAIAGTENEWLSNIYCFYTVDFLPNVLLGRLAGDKIADMESLSDMEIIESCKHIFSQFLPKEWKITEIVDVKTSKWKTSKSFGGTYSYREHGGSLGANLAEPIYDNQNNLKIQFAGEATHDWYFSTVHGAIESGWREANRLIHAHPA